MLIPEDLCETQNSRQILDSLQTDVQDIISTTDNWRRCEYIIVNTSFISNMFYTRTTVTATDLSK